MKKIINTTNAPKPIGPYNQAILNNGILYVSGQIAFNPATGKLVLDDIKSETKQVLDNIKSILQEAGMDFTNLVKTTIYISDLDHFAGINEVYGSYFSGNYPAREVAQVARLPLNVNLEISAIAAK